MERFFQSTGTKGFILVEKKEVVVRNFRKDVLTVHRGQTTPTFEPEEDLKEFDLRVYKLTGARTPFYFKNSNMDLLIANLEKSIVTFGLKNPTKDEKAVFYVNRYAEIAESKGLPVVISCTVSGRNYFLCARSNSVVLQESELPEEIPTKTSEFIFYMINFSPGDNGFRFESSLNLEPPEQRFCFAWDHTDPSKNVILKPHQEDVTDETMRILLSKVS
ncbi:uncharacterized protein [Engystomops pustulosus]|uniref:uncharacterized protein n=1 Tax=Engystomops pustulosus TaxID=76066 RepID=UPI003AFA1B4E